MLDVSPSNLLLEVQTSIEYVRGYLAAYEHHRRVMAGPCYNELAFEDADDGSFWGTAYDPENVVHEFLAHVGPRMAFHNPYFKAGSKRPGTQQAVALGIRHALNRLVRDIRMYETNRVLLADFAMAWFWAMVHETERTDWVWRDPTDPVVLPALERISPRHGFWDPQALERKKIRLIGHVWERDKDDLLKAAKEDPQSWNHDAIDSVQAGSGQEYLKRDGDAHMVERNTITGATVWLPDYEDDEHPGPDEGFHGSIVDLALGADSGDEGTLLRPLRPYYGPRWGPYIVCGARIVPDETAFLSPITAAAAQIRDLNSIARRGVANAKNYRRIMILNDAQDELSERIENEPNRSIFPAAGVKKDDIHEVEINGNTQQEIAQEIRQRSRVDRALAQDDAQRGTVNNQGTATAVAEAAANSNSQADELAQTFAHGIEQIGIAFAYYLYHDDRIVMSLGEDAANELGMKEPFYFGGDDRDPAVRRRHLKRLRRMGQIPPQEWMLWGGDEDRRFGATFDDLEIELEIGSMKHIDPRIRAQQVRNCFDAAVTVAQVIAQAPWLDGKGLLQLIGEDNDMPGLEDLLDEKLFQQMMKGALAQHGPRQVPMLARFAGAGGGAKPGAGAGQGSQPQGGMQRPFGGGRGGAPAQPGGGASARASKAGSAKSTP